MRRAVHAVCFAASGCARKGCCVPNGTQHPFRGRLTRCGPRGTGADAVRAQRLVQILALLTVVTGEDDVAARRKFAGCQSYVNPEGMLALFGGWTGLDRSSPVQHRYRPNAFSTTSFPYLYYARLLGPSAVSTKRVYRQLVHHAHHRGQVRLATPASITCGG